MYPHQTADCTADILQHAVLTAVGQVIATKLAGYHLVHNCQHNRLKHVSWAACPLIRVHVCPSCSVVMLSILSVPQGCLQGPLQPAQFRDCVSFTRCYASNRCPHIGLPMPKMTLHTHHGLDVHAELHYANMLHAPFSLSFYWWICAEYEGFTCCR